MFDIFRNLDQKNSSLEETNKSQDNFKAANVFLKCFKEEHRHLQEKGKF